jgi:hypothetical protein
MREAADGLGDHLGVAGCRANYSDTGHQWGKIQCQWARSFVTGHYCPVTSKIPQRMPLTCKEESILSIFGRHRVRFDRFADRSGTSCDNEVCPLASLADRLGRLSSCVNVSVSSLSAAA